LHLEGALSVRSVIEAVASGVADGAASVSEERRPVIALIVTAMRSHPPGANVLMARTAAEFGPPVVGFDLAGAEAEWPAPPHAAAFRAAAADGLRLTAHAGEVPGAERIAEVLDFGVERIAHGTAVADDEPLVARLIADGITLDMCPTSNVQAGIVTDLASHPLARLHRRGVSVTLSTDDRVVSDLTLTDEMARTAAALELGADELAAIALNGFDRAFAPVAAMAPLRAEARRAWAAWAAPDRALTG
jgi:adenosine deaminase